MCTTQGGRLILISRVMVLGGVTQPKGIVYEYKHVHVHIQVRLLEQPHPPQPCKQEQRALH